MEYKYNNEVRSFWIKRSTSGDTTTSTKTSTLEKQQPTQSDTVTGAQQEHQPSQFSSDDDETLPDPFPMAKTFETKAPKSIPKKPKFSSSQK